MVVPLQGESHNIFLLLEIHLQPLFVVFQRGAPGS